MSKNRTVPHILAPALEAIADLLVQEFRELKHLAGMEALMAQSEIEQAQIAQKTRSFYRHYVPLRNQMVGLLAESYRRFFKLALAHVSPSGDDPDRWAQEQLWPAVCAAIDWIRDWYILACDGESQTMRRVGSMPFVPGETVSLNIPMSLPPLPPPTSWRAPIWLFEVSPLVGITALKEQHFPTGNSIEKLGKGHTRLVLKGARRMFFWQLAAAIEKVRNEEIAAAGAIRAEVSNRPERPPNKRQGWEQRLKLYRVIRKVLRVNPKLEGMDFCAELDKRHAPPLHDWVKRGEWREGLTWKEAWNQPQLRSRIRRVRQEAQKATLD